VEQLKTMRGVSLLKVATIMPIAAPPARPLHSRAKLVRGCETVRGNLAEFGRKVGGESVFLENQVPGAGRVLE
jgi:hypothetical protein